MRITFVLPFAGLSGGNRVVATYARILHERGYDVTVVSRAYSPPKGLKPKIKFLLGLEKRQKPTQTPLLDFLGEKHRIVNHDRLLDTADVPDADVIIATWWATAESVAALPPSKGRKFYLLQGYEVFPYLPVDRVIATYSLPLQKIAVSSYIIDEISKNHAVNGIHLVANAVDLDQFKAPPRTPNRVPTVGFLYTRQAIKNVRLAIDAVTLVKKRLPDLKVKAFGTRQADASLPLPSWVEYHVAPPQQDIAGIYAACDAWLFTSQKEGFGLPILEAMACRTPVLATHAGAAPDLIDGTNGTLLPGSVEAFTSEIERFAAMPESEWQNYSDAAYRTATTYTWQDATDRLLEILEEDTSAPSGRETFSRHAE